MAININYRKRLLAAFIHFLITLLVAGIAAALIFFVWFPADFAKMVGGWRLFVLVVCSDIVLGPVVSLVIFNTQKSRKELIADYVIVGFIQLAALIYGMSAIVVARPVYIVFAVDRFEIVMAVELDAVDLVEAVDSQYRSLPWLGPRLVGLQLPTDMNERNRVLFSAVAGKDAYQMPKYYQSYDSMIGQIKSASLPLSLLRERNTNFSDQLTLAIQDLGVSESDVRWLPVHHHFGFWTALVNAKTGHPIKYLPIDPL